MAYDISDDQPIHVTLTGSVTVSDEEYPIKIEFTRCGYDITDCIYTNLTYHGKIRMTGNYIDMGCEGYEFHGKDGNKDFVIDVSRISDYDPFEGEFRDGADAYPVTLR